MANNFFTHSSAGTLTFNTKGHLVEGSDVSLAFNMATGVSKGGTRYAESFGDNRTTHQFTAIIPISDGALTDRADVVTFFDTILGAVESFTWTDEAATARTVRCVDGEIMFKTLAYKPTHQMFTLRLEEV